MENTVKSLLKPHPKKSTKGGLKSSVLLGQWLTYRTQRERPLSQGFIYVTTWKERLLAKKRKSLKERGGLSSGWSLKNVLSHQGGLSSGWSLIRVVSQEGALSPGWSLIRVVSHHGGLSTKWSLNKVVSHQGGLSSVWYLLGGLSQGGLLLGWSLNRVVFHQGGL